MEKANKDWQKKWEERKQKWKEEVKGRRLFSLQKRVNLPRKRRRASKGKERVTITRLGIGQSHVNRTLLTVGKHPTGNNRRCSFSLEKDGDDGWTEEPGNAGGLRRTTWTGPVGGRRFSHLLDWLKGTEGETSEEEDLKVALMQQFVKQF